MSRSKSLVLSVCLVAFLISTVSIVGAQSKAEQTVHFGDTSGFLALPSGGGRHPGIVVIHEWWGLNDWVREQARKLASQGYVALAPDLFGGRVATTPDEAMQLVQSFDQQRGLAQLQAAVQYLNGRNDVRKDDIGVIGWCWGGGQSATLAENEPSLKACVVYYGEVPTDAGTAAKIHAPVLGNFGGADQSITPDRVHKFEAAMREAGRSADVKIYPGMPHAFAGSRAKQPAQLAAAQDAWHRTMQFLREHLAP